MSRFARFARLVLAFASSAAFALIVDPGIIDPGKRW
jgi:phage-related tail fiber protein